MLKYRLRSGENDSYWEGDAMISRRGALIGLAGLAIPALTGCGSRSTSAPSYAYAPPGGGGPKVAGLDAVIDISHNVRVSDFNLVRKSDILAVTRPGPRTLIALDFEVNDPNPNNTMTLAQAEEFVHVVRQATGRLPM